VLGWVNTRVILTLIFYLVFTPIGLVMRIFGKDILEAGPGKTKNTYWKKKDQSRGNPAYEQQF
jgi:hypothetical protein